MKARLRIAVGLMAVVYQLERFGDWLGSKSFRLGSRLWHWGNRA